MSDEKVRTEEYKVTADETMAKVKELVAEGNIRRIIIQTEEGKTLSEVLSLGGQTGGKGLPLDEKQMLRFSQHDK